MWTQEELNDAIKLAKEGKTYEEIGEILKRTGHAIKCKFLKNGISITQFKSLKKDTVIRCLNCGKEVYGGVKKFCNQSCSAIYNNKKRGNRTEEEKFKIKIGTLKRFGFNSIDEWKEHKKEKNIGVCLNCEKEFEKKKKKNVYCSRSCQAKHISNKPESKARVSELFSKLTKERHEQGDDRICWKSRNKITPSYPEKVTIDYFKYNNIEFVREFLVGRYFIDFAFLDKKIALEIDGRTHDDIAVIEKDMRKDDFLKSNGWKVYRIKWINDNKHFDRLNAFIVQMG